MATYYVDPNDEPRECTCYEGERYLASDGTELHESDPDGEWTRCGDCRGTGRLGNPEARPEIEVYYTPGESGTDPKRAWYWRATLAAQLGRESAGYAHGRFPTEAAALAAARAALGVKS